MRGALERGGRAVGILADDLERAVMNRENRSPIMDGRLLLISPYDPNAGFNVGNAMQRNKLVYASAEATLVVNADLERGGTWHGAVEQLEKHRFTKVFIRSEGEIGEGLRALQRKGAAPWPNPETPAAFESVLTAAAASYAPVIREEQSEFGFAGRRESGAPVGDAAPPAKASVMDPPASRASDAPPPPRSRAEELFAKVRDLLATIDAAKTPGEVAAELEVAESQAKKWLERLVKEGALEKLSRPVRYRPATAAGELFAERPRGPRREEQAPMDG